MSLILPIVFGVVALIGLIAIFGSSKNWRWHTILSSLLLLVASVAFFYLSARTLLVHRAWATAARNIEAATLKVEGNPDSTAEETDKEHPSNVVLQRELAQLKNEIHDTIADRGRVWFDSKRAGGGPEGGLSVNIESPDPHQLAEKTNVYVFDTDDQGFGSYLGEFRVAAVKGKQVDLAPLFPESDRERAKIKGSRNSLMIFERMPTDNHEAYTGLNDEGIRNLLPGAPGRVLDEFLKDGQPAGINDPPENIEVRVKFLKDQPIATAPGAKPEEPKVFKEGTEVWLPLLGSASVPGADALIRQGVAEEDRTMPRRLVRPLRDYKRIFDEDYQERALIRTGIEQATRDGEAVHNAEVAAQEQIKTEQSHRGALSGDLQKLKAELVEVGKLLNALDGQWNAVRVELGRVFASNKQLADQLTSMQFKSAEEIQSRTSATASSPSTLGQPRIP